MVTLRRSLPFLALAFAAALVVAWTTTPTPERKGSPTSEVGASPLIGTWVVVFPDPGSFRSLPVRDAQASDSDEVLKRLLRETQSMSLRITYRADRSGLVEASASGVDRKQKFSWSILAASPAEIRIDQEMSDPPSLERITYRVESPDRLTIMTGAMEGSSLTRVK